MMQRYLAFFSVLELSSILISGGKDTRKPRFTPSPRVSSAKDPSTTPTLPTPLRPSSSG